MHAAAYLKDEANNLSGDDHVKRVKASQFQPKDGINIRCPACFIEENEYVNLTPFAHDDPKNYDGLRCTKHPGAHRFAIPLRYLR